MDFLTRRGPTILGVVGGLYVLYKYAELKWRDMEARRDLDRTAKAHLKLRFEQNQKDCTFTVLRLLPTLVFHIYPALDVESVTAALQQQRSTKATTVEAAEALKKRKLEMWADLKILSFTRTISSVYLVTLLTVFTHLQLNLLGRFIYIDSVVAQTAARRLEGRFADEDDEDEDDDSALSSIKGAASATGGSKLFDPATGAPRKALSFETERMYLTFSWFLLNVGWRRCVDRVRSAVEKVVGEVGLNKPVSFEFMVGLINQVREEVEGGKSSAELSAFAKFLLPEEGAEAEVLREGGASEEQATTMEPQLKQLVDETRDFLDTPDFSAILKSCLDQSFDLLTKQLYPTFFGEEDLQPSNSNIVELKTSKEMPLAAALPAVSRLVNATLNADPNLFVEILSSLPELKTFSVVVYTGWGSQE
ncbi:Peroxin-3 [Zopfochytrium polystomum]|nr:Peroxin-3 [Zopfochytrium polystomum]